MGYYAINNNELYHHGIKGQKWGVRRFQNPDGSYTAAGKRRYYVGEGRIESFKDVKKQKGSMTAQEYKDYAATYLLGKNRVDRVIKLNTDFSRIQKETNFEKQYAFYATYKDHDKNLYAGLFGKNLKDRAKHLSEEEGGGKSIDVYQLHIKNTKNLRIPSDQNASRITADLLKDDEFKNNLKLSIEDSKAIMRRPSQQIVFNDSLKALNKPLNKLSDKDKETIYKSMNITLVNHKPFENAVQDKFYSALKKEGYSAIIDINDQKYSSYHAKMPMIVFDTDKVNLQSATKMNDAQISKLYSKYNKERIMKDSIYNAVQMPADALNSTISQARKRMNSRTRDYLEEG